MCVWWFMNFGWPYPPPPPPHPTDCFSIHMCTFVPIKLLIILGRFPNGFSITYLIQVKIKAKLMFILIFSINPVIIGTKYTVILVELLILSAPSLSELDMDLNKSIIYQNTGAATVTKRIMTLDLYIVWLGYCVVVILCVQDIVCSGHRVFRT